MTNRFQAAVVGIFILGLVVGPQLEMGDFVNVYYPVAQAVWRGQPCYSVPGFFNPPWVAVLLAPLGLLPLGLAKAIFFSTSLTVFICLPMWLGLPRWMWVLWPISPPVLCCLYEGNLDWMVFLGLLLPAWAAPWAFLIKPQLGLLAALNCFVIDFPSEEQGHDIYLYKSYRYNVMLITAAVLLILMLPSITRFQDAIAYTDFNSSLIPTPWKWFSISMGCLFLLEAVAWRSPIILLGAMPFFSPYVVSYTWAGVWLSVLVILEKNVWERARTEEVYVQ